MPICLSEYSPEEIENLLKEIATDQYSDSDIIFANPGNTFDLSFIFTRLMRAFKTNTKIKSLDLSSLGLSSKQIAQLGKMLLVNQGIESLSLPYKTMTNREVEILANALRHNPRLRFLEVSENNADLLNALIPQQNRSNASITNLCLMGEALSTTTLKKIKTILSTNTMLTRLDLSRGNINDLHMLYLAEGFINNRTLQTLILNENPLSMEAASLLAKVLKRSNTLYSLHLAQCGFYRNDPSLTVLLEAISANTATNLRELYLGYNDFVDALIPMLSSNRSLRVLCLMACALQPKDFFNLARALLRNHTLTDLNLTYSLPRSVGRAPGWRSRVPFAFPEPLMRVLRDYNHTLQHVRVEGNEIASNTFCALDPILTRNRQFAASYQSSTRAYARIAILIAFMRANAKSFFISSILDLIKDPNEQSIFGYVNDEYAMPKRRPRIGLFHHRTSTSTSSTSQSHTAAQASETALALAQTAASSSTSGLHRPC